MARGLRKQIGDGRSTSVIEDPWVPRPYTFKVFMQGPINGVRMVVDLFFPSGSWNLQKLREALMPEDVEEILQIPLCPTNKEDRWIWHYDNKGEYSVKSGYKCAILHRILSRGSWSIIELTWRNRLWKLPIPAKVTLFVRKICYESIPAFVPLRRMDITLLPWC